jgi:integrase
MSRSPHVFRVGDTWHYRFAIAGKRVQRTTRETVRAKAEAIAARAFEDAKIRSRGDEPCPTMAQLVEMWLDSNLRTAGPDHRKSIEIFGRRHLYGLKDLLVCDLTTQVVSEARTIHLESHSMSTANHWLTSLKLLVNFAISRNMLRRKEWHLKPFKIQRKPKVTLSPGSTTAWLEIVDRHCPKDPGLKTIVRLALGLGLRGSEATGARWEWLSWERMTYIPGRLSDTGAFMTKGKEAEGLPVLPWLAAFLAPFRRDNGLIAPDRSGKAYSVARMRALMQAVNAEAGTPGLTPHRLRGTYATLLIEDGCPLQDVQAALRHKDIKTTLGYVERDMGRVAKAQDSMARRQGLALRENAAPSPAEPASPGSNVYRES